MFDICAAVTDRIIAAMEEGTIPWHKPWAINSTNVKKAEAD